MFTESLDLHFVTCDLDLAGNCKRSVRIKVTVTVTVKGHWQVRLGLFSLGFYNTFYYFTPGSNSSDF